MTDANILDWNDADLEFKALSGQLNVDEAQGIVECFVAAIGNKDSVGDIVASGAFDGSLRRRKPRVVWGHDWNQPIGKVLAIEEVPASDPRLPAKMKTAGVGGLLARVQFNLKSERGREAFNSVAFFGGDQEWSIGYKTLKADYDPDRQANVLKEVELFEVSPVLHGANQLTGTISIKAANGKDRVDSFDKSQWPMFDRSFAERIKNQHPQIWDAGGNIKGDDQYTILTKIAEQGGKARTEDQIKALELREAWIARHKGDFRLPGVIAQVKWLAIGTRGEGHMKKTINDAIAKMNTKSHGMWDDDEPDMHMLMGERRVPMFIHADGMGRIVDGDNVHTVDISRFHGANSHLDDERPNIGQAISTHVGAPIQLRLVEDNFVIFDMDVDDDGDDDSFFLPYHFETMSGRYMFGNAMPVEMEYDLHFGEDEDDEDDEDQWDDDWDDDENGAWSDEDDEDRWADEYHAEMKAIGQAIGPKGPQNDPNQTTDHDGDGIIFDGTPNEQRAPKKRPEQGQGGKKRPTNIELTEGGQKYNVRNGKRTPVYGAGKGPVGPAGPKGRNTQQVENARAVAKLRKMRRDINEQGSTPQGEQTAGERMRDVGRFLRAARERDAANQDFTIYEDGSGNATTRDGRVIKVPGRDEPKKRERAIRQMDEVQRRQLARVDEALRERRTGEPYSEDRATAAAAKRELEVRRDEINKRGSTAGGERRASQEMRDVGRFLRAAEANDRARNGAPAGPAGPAGKPGQVDKIRAEKKRREAVARLERQRDEINKRGSQPGGERRAGREMQDVGRFLGAAEENQRVRERQVANRAAGPAGARGPKANYGQSESGRTPDNYDGNAARMSNGFQQPYYSERTGKFRNVRTPFKSAQQDDYTEYDPAATLDDLEWGD